MLCQSACTLCIYKQSCLVHWYRQATPLHYQILFSSNLLVVCGILNFITIAKSGQVNTPIVTGIDGGALHLLPGTPQASQRRESLSFLTQTFHCLRMYVYTSGHSGTSGLTVWTIFSCMRMFHVFGTFPNGYAGFEPAVYPY